MHVLTYTYIVMYVHIRRPRSRSFRRLKYTRLHINAALILTSDATFCLQSRGTGTPTHMRTLTQ